VSKKTKAGGAKPITMVTTGSQISEADRKLFTADELEALESEVILEVQSDMREEAKGRVREQLRAQKRLEMQRATDPDEAVFNVTIDVAPYADRVMLDNVIYLHGITYEVPKRVYDTIKEVMGRTWEHEATRGNPNANYYQKPRHTRIGPRDAGADASALLMRV
jgi:hypothetical protein